MKRKIIIFFLLMILVVPIRSFAADYGSYYYVPYLDQYRFDYSYNTADVRFDLVFNAADGTTYTANYDFKPTGIHYLTCNGTYNMNFYDSSGSVVHTAGPLITTEIINPSCDSYPDGVSGKNDLNARQSGGKLEWDPMPNATNYEVWKDGTKISDTSDTTYTPDSDGGYSIVARDSSGNILGQSDLMYSTCDVCEKLSQALQCPDWNTYMGDLTQAVKNALPPPPDWDAISEKIGTATINHLQDYFGPVPTAPTQAEIDSNLNKQLPVVDATYSEAETLVPTVPPDYDQQQPFDITSGPQIDIVDESQPFQILDPLNNLQFDDPGVPVIPGDPNNSTGDIQKPAIIAPYPTVTPQPLPSALPDNPVPIPSSSPGSAPAPTTDSSTTGTGPIPVWKGD